jgi:hypothetical protein
MPRTLTTLEDLVRALEDKIPAFVLDEKLAVLAAKVATAGPDKVRGELAAMFDRGREKLERELRQEIGEVPQKAKDLMREQTLAAMENLLAAVAQKLGQYQSKDGRTFARR